MVQYILDTHILLWFLEKDQRLPMSIREDIEYFQHEYFVSFLSLIEVDNLNKLGKIDLKYSFKELMERLQNSCIGVIFSSLEGLKELFSLDMKVINKKTHGDYMDRAIIATAIAKHYTCISADAKFRHYRENGLQLLEV